MSDEPITDEQLVGRWKAVGNIRRKLRLAGVADNTSVMRMVEDAKVELLRLREVEQEKAEMWRFVKRYVRDSLANERAQQARIDALEEKLTLVPADYFDLLRTSLDEVPEKKAS